jgi:hypothetical protein
MLQRDSEEEWDGKGYKDFSSVLGKTELEEAKYEEGYGRSRGCNKVAERVYLHTKSLLLSSP